MRELLSCVDPDLPLMKERLVALFAHLRSRIESKSDEALTSYLNNRLPSGSKFVRDSVRRWANGTQIIGKPNKVKLSQALGCSHETLEGYLRREVSEKEFFKLIDAIECDAPTTTEAEMFAQAVGLVQQFSLPLLGRMVAVVGELFAERWNEFTANLSEAEGQTTLSQLVAAHLEECIEALEGGICAERLKALALGEKPTETEVAMLSTVLPATLEELEELYRREFGNGYRPGCNHPS